MYTKKEEYNHISLQTSQFQPYWLTFIYDLIYMRLITDFNKEMSCAVYLNSRNILITKSKPIRYLLDST